MDEVPAISSEPKESSHFLQVSGGGPASHLLYLRIFHLHLVIFDAYPEEVDVWLFELALVNVKVEAVLFEDGKHFIDYFSVVLQVLFMHLSLPWARMHSHVIHVDGELPAGYLVAE